MNTDRMWNLIKRIVAEVEQVREGEEDSSSGEYVLLKDCNKMELRIYKKDMEEDDEEGEEEVEEK